MSVLEVFRHGDNFVVSFDTVAEPLALRGFRLGRI